VGPAPYQGSLAKKISPPEYGDDFGFGAFFRCLQDLDLAIFNDAKHPSHLSLPVNEISGAKVGTIEVLRSVGIEKAEIAGKKKVPTPV
jgi:hypothetical protein